MFLDRFVEIFFCFGIFFLTFCRSLSFSQKLLLIFKKGVSIERPLTPLCACVLPWSLFFTWRLCLQPSKKCGWIFDRWIFDPWFFSFLKNYPFQIWRIRVFGFNELSSFKKLPCRRGFGQFFAYNVCYRNSQIFDRFVNLFDVRER